MRSAMRRAFAVVLLLAGSLALSGCLTAPTSRTTGGSEAEHRLTGAFTANATQADLAEAAALAEAQGGTMVFLESFPVQLAASGLGPDECARLRDALAAKPYVARVGECAPATSSESPDEPVSDGPSGADAGHALHGRFTAEATGEEMREASAIVEAEGGHMAILKSHPAQLSASGLTAEGCARAQAALAAKPYVADVGPCTAPAASPAEP